MAEEEIKFELNSTVVIKTKENMNQLGIVRYFGEVKLVMLN